MNDLSQKSIFKKLSALLLGNGMSQIINTFFVLFLVRIFSQEDYAIYRLGNQIIVTLSPFFVLGLPMTISLFLPKYQKLKDRKNFIFQTIFFLLVLGILGSALLLFSKQLIFNIYKNSALLDYLWVFALSFLSEVVFSYFPFYMTTENKNKKLAISVTILSLIKLSAILVAMMFQNSFDIFMYVFALSSLVKLIYVIVEPMIYYKISFQNLGKVDVKRQLVESIPIGMTNVIAAFSKNLGSNLVSIKYNTVKFATYVTGAFEVPFIGILRTSITGAILPSFSSIFSKDDKDSHHQIIESFKKTVTISVAIIVPIMLGLITYSYGAILLLFPNYTDANIIFKIYMLLLPTQIANFSTLLLIANKQNRVLMYSLASILVNVVAFFIFYETVGFYFVAFSTVIAEYFQLIFILFDVKKYYSQKSVFNVFPAKEFFKILCYNGLVFLAIYLGASTVFNLRSVFFAVLFGAISFIVCLFINISMFPEMRNKLIRRVRK